MSPLGLLALYLACGIATFPLTILLVRGAVMLLSPARATTAFHTRMDRATATSVAVWILGALLFYAAMVALEWRKPCDDQRTNQLTAYCKKKLGATPDAR